MATFQQEYCSMNSSIFNTVIWVYVYYVNLSCTTVNLITEKLKYVYLGKNVGMLVLRGKK